MNIKSLLLILIIVFSVSLYGYARNLYIVKSGDRLTEVLKLFQLVPIYGKNGSLNEVIRLNSFLIQKQGDLIFPNQKIILPIKIGNQFHKLTGVPNKKVFVENRYATQKKNQENYIYQNPEVTTSEEDIIKSAIQVTMDLIYFRIDSFDIINQTNALFLSRLTPVIKLDLLTDWSSELSYLIGYQFLYDDIYQNGTSQVQIQDRNGIRHSIYAGLNYHWNDQNHSLFKFGSSEKLFSYSTDVQVIQLSRVAVPFANFEHSIALFNKKNGHFGVSVGIGYLHNASGEGLSVMTGYSYKVGSYLQQNFLNSQLQSHIFYEQSFQDTDISNNSEKTIGLGIVYKTGLSNL